MSLSLETKKHRPPRILIYGAHGLGKSTFGAMAPDPVFVQTEDGLDAIDVPAFPLAKSYQDVLKYLGELCQQDHNYKTLVVDSLDWLEPLIWAQLLAERPTTEKGVKVKQIEDYGYGKGYGYALDIWSEYINAINYLRNERNMMIVQTAHASIRKFENPETEAYDRYEIKLHKGAAAKIQEHCDIVLFANYFVGVKKENEGFKDRKRAIGSSERILYTEERPSAIAKNRYSLPAEIPFDKDGNYWGVIASHVPYLNKGENNG